ncbi:MAG: hypothetical protein ACRCSK_02300 [Fusobacteriaceae bacterium]
MTYNFMNIYHILLIFSPIVFSLAIFYFLKKKPNLKSITANFLAIAIVLILIFRSDALWYSNYKFLGDIIPIQVCGLAAVTIFCSIIFKSKIAEAMAFCLHLPFAFCALLFPSFKKNLPISSLEFISYSFLHVFIVAIILVFILCKIYTFNYKKFWQSLCLTSFIYWISLPASFYMNENFVRDPRTNTANFFYSVHDAGTPLKLLNKLPPINIQVGNYTINLVYSFGVFFVGTFLYLLLGYFFFKLTNKNTKKN